MMRFIFLWLIFCSSCTLTVGQGISQTKWYSETTTDGIILQNSLPKGGPYTGPIKKMFNSSQLVFFTRVVNQTQHPIELDIHFSADSIPIPDSPNTFVKVFLPSDTMTPEKQSQYNYGVRALESLDQPTRFQKIINPNEECLFLVQTIFYQTIATPENQERGGNRAEFVLKGQDLFYRMLPQIDLLPCGQIIIKK